MQEIAYQVVRSNRKSVALVIDNEANLIVRAPVLMPDTVIDEFVRKKKRWINEKQQQVAVFGEKHPSVVVETGEMHYVPRQQLRHHQGCGRCS